MPLRHVNPKTGNSPQLHAKLLSKHKPLRKKQERQAKQIPLAEAKAAIAMANADELRAKIAEGATTSSLSSRGSTKKIKVAAGALYSTAVLTSMPQLSPQAAAMVGALATRPGPSSRTSERFQDRLAY